MHNSTLAASYILLGSGGHARVVQACLQLAKLPVAGCVVNEARVSILGIPVMGNDQWLLQQDPQRYLLALGVGSTQASTLRARLFQTFTDAGFTFPVVCHPTAVVDASTHLSAGVQVMAGAVLQPGCLVGHNCIINTRCAIDHDCQLGDHVHISPGAVLCGDVVVAAGAHIGAGAVVKQGVRIGADATVGMGAVVLHDVPAGAVVVGNPARLLRQ